MFKGHRYVPAIALAAVVAVATPACAAQGPLYRYPNSRGVVDNRAYDTGYRQGRRDGEEDARRRRSPDFTRHREFRDADQGYRGGNRNAYRELYRQGFSVGYNEGYKVYARRDRAFPAYPAYPTYPTYPTYPPYPSGSSRFGSPAAEHGFRDGFDQGRADGRNRARFDPVRARAYRDGDRGYDRRFGSRDEYRREYRAAFQQGYEKGYAQF